MANGEKENRSLGERFQTLSQSYTSLILGILVVIIIAILAVGLVRRNTGFTPTITPPTETPAESQMREEQQKMPPTAYTVVAGDTLWTIGEKFYKSGYNWVDVAKSNNLKNPDLLYVGTNLTIPKVEPKVPTLTEADQQNAITGGNYTVEKGDTVWDIAVRAYGDGYKWVEIAKANKLINPDVIDAGQTFTIPR